MKLFRYLFLLTLVIGFLSCKKDKLAPPNQGDAFIKYYGHVRDQVGSDMKRTADGGYILIGSSNAYATSAAHDYLLVKTDSFGNEEWSKTFGDGEGRFDEKGIALAILQDESGYIIAGNRTQLIISGSSTIAGESRIVLYKLDLDGNVVWERVLNNNLSISFSDEVADIKEIPGGAGFVLIGSSTRVSGKPESAQFSQFDTWDILCARLDAEGFLVTEVLRGFVGEDRGRSVELVNNGFIITGTESFRAGGTNQSPVFGKQFLCARLSFTNLQEIWYRNFDTGINFPGMYIEAAYSCMDSTNAQRIITLLGYIEDRPSIADPQEGDIILVQITEDGGIVRTPTFLGKTGGGIGGIVGNLKAASIAVVPSEFAGEAPSFILTATHSVGSDGSECMLLKINNDLSPAWTAGQFFGRTGIGGQWLSGNQAGRVMPLMQLVPGTTREELNGYLFTGTFDLGTNTMIGLVKTNIEGTMTPIKK